MLIKAITKNQNWTGLGKLISSTQIAIL